MDAINAAKFPLLVIVNIRSEIGEEKKMQSENEKIADNLVILWWQLCGDDCGLFSDEAITKQDDETARTAMMMMMMIKPRTSKRPESNWLRYMTVVFLNSRIANLTPLTSYRSRRRCVADR